MRCSPRAWPLGRRLQTAVTRPLRPGAAALLLAFLLAAALSTIAAEAAGPVGPPEQPAVRAGPPAQFERPDAAAIRAEAGKILSDPRFAPRTTLTQWLLRKLMEWGGPDLDLSKGVARLLLWFLIIWCVLTLLAILVHVTWTLSMLLRRRLQGRGIEGRRGRFKRAPAASYKEVREEMRRLAEQGALREALSLMMTALLLWLDEAGVVRWHQSKTNGDYVREYPSSRAAGDVFRRFVGAFDSVVYGGAPCERETYGRMHAMFDQVMSSVSQQP